LKLNPTSLQGAIVDAGSQRPLRGVLVTARNAEGKEVSRTLTDDAGQYSFGRIGSGVYTITAALTGYETRESQINIPLQNTFSFTLAKASSILVNDHKPQSFPANPASSSLASNWVRAMLQDQAGLLWCATERGVSTFDGGPGFVAFDKVPELAMAAVRALVEDRQGELWFGTGSGVIRYNPKDGQTARELTGFNVRTISQDDDGVLWFATNRGLARFDGGQFTVLGEAHGLGSEDVSLVFCERRRHLVWLVTARGLALYNGAEFQPARG
jgi:hypothetical protein